MVMKALAILQPYAWLCAAGIKDLENRTWPTKYRGPVLIHASKKYPADCFADDFDEYQELGFPRTREEMTGGIVGIATIVDCVTSSRSRWWVGPFGFVLADARPCPLVPCVGKLGFFDVPADVLAKLPQGLLEMAHAQT